jgi:small subunit ribosomal protein S11e
MVAAKKQSTTKYAKTASVNPAVQTERAYQAQTGVFENTRNPAKKNLNKSGRLRYFKNVGLGFRTPKDASNASYVDKKCPFTGNVSIRGRILRGKVVSTSMKRSLVMRRDYLHFIQKYQRYQKRHRNFTVHCSPAFSPTAGDEVIVGQCRPLSKTIRYNVLQTVVHGADKGAGKKFTKN